jgi:phthalate 4,5-cis-dihydrodiol dehydrogenase
MARAAEEAGVHVVVGHSHSFDAPIAKARAIIAGGELGRVRMITAMYFTDFLYRPRRPEELDTARGGGVVFSQAAHQVDIVRLLGGGMVKSVRAMTGCWDPARPTEGAYSALLAFEDGTFASLAYSGYGHFDGDELMGGVSEIGRPKDAAAYGAMRRGLAQQTGPAAEAAAKNARNYGGSAYRDAPPEPPWHEHFGLVIASCERGDVRPTPDGVTVYGDAAKWVEPLERPAVPRREVIDELRAAALDGRKPLHDARWGMASLEVCVALLQSAREQRDIGLHLQVPVERP